MTAAARARLRVRVPLLAISAAAWLVLVLHPHAAGCAMPSMPWTPASLLAASALMFAAMMAPLIGAPLRHVRDRSFARRRVRATALFVTSYALPWLAAGAALLIAAKWIATAPSPLLPALAVAGIALWQCSPAKQHSLNHCHAHGELAAFGAKADLDVLRFGFQHALWCIASCSALMLLPMLFADGHLLLMAIVTLWLAGERLEKPLPPRWRWRGPGKMMRIALGLTFSTGARVRWAMK